MSWRDELYLDGKTPDKRAIDESAAEYRNKSIRSIKKACEACLDSGRPGYLIFAKYYDRVVDGRLTSGIDYLPCYVCRGTGRAILDELKLEE